MDFNSKMKINPGAKVEPNEQNRFGIQATAIDCLSPKGFKIVLTQKATVMIDQLSRREAQRLIWCRATALPHFKISRSLTRA